MPKLPKDILIERILNELKVCKRHFKHNFFIMSKSLNEFPIEVDVEMFNTPAPIRHGSRIETKYEHKFTLMIPEDYPYHKPTVKWKTEIFHPNIMHPKNGGFVCTNLLTRWNFKSTLKMFIKGIESLLSNPNPMNPFETPSCSHAADYFKENDFKPPGIVETKKSLPKIIKKDKITNE
jgi:ubiquitin-protein ligase